MWYMQATEDSQCDCHPFLPSMHDDMLICVVVLLMSHVDVLEHAIVSELLFASCAYRYFTQYCGIWLQPALLSLLLQS